MIYGSLDERERQIEEGARQAAYRKLQAELREQQRAARKRELFGWPGILRTIAWAAVALIVLVGGGGHVIGCW